MNKPIADKGEICPFNGKDVSKVCHKCPLYVQLRGSNPQTGQEVDQWSCSLAILPILMIETSQNARHTTAAVESFRNEVVKDNAAISSALQIASEAARHKIEPLMLEGEPHAARSRS